MSTNQAVTNRNRRTEKLVIFRAQTIELFFNYTSMAQTYTCALILDLVDLSRRVFHSVVSRAPSLGFDARGGHEQRRRH